LVKAHLRFERIDGRGDVTDFDDGCRLRRTAGRPASSRLLRWNGNGALACGQ